MSLDANPGSFVFKRINRKERSDDRKNGHKEHKEHKKELADAIFEKGAGPLF
jgi:hypothetical protein